jgi:peptidyl-tRNA hydrolase
VLEAFQTDTLPRMRIGVRREGLKRPAANDILQSFDADEQRLIDAALDEAVRRKFGEVLETVVTTHAKPIRPAQEPGQAERG